MPCPQNSDNGEKVLLSMRLNSKTNVTKTNAGFYASTLSYMHSAIRIIDRKRFDLPDFKHFTSVAVVAVFDHGDIYVDDVATFNCL